MKQFAVGNPDYSVAWRGPAADALRALDAFAEQEGFALYSDLVADEELDPDHSLICQLESGEIWAIMTNYSVTPMQTDFLIRIGETEPVYLPRTNAEGDLLCPICSTPIESQWADDGEASLADWWECSADKHHHGGLVKTEDIDRTQNDVWVHMGERMDVHQDGTFVTLMDTTHFSFIAVGTTAREAEIGIVNGFTRHLMQTTPGETTEDLVRENFLAGIADDAEDTSDEAMRRELHEYYGLRTVKLRPGQCSRDEDQVV